MKSAGLKSLWYSVARISTLTGGFFYYYCIRYHTCICGHMQHPPYSEVDYIAEGIWMPFLIVATLSALLCQSKKTFISAAFLVVLIASKAALDNAGGMGFILQLPLLAWVVIMLIPSKWFNKFSRCHIFLPLIFLIQFVFAQALENLHDIALYADGNWWLCIHPRTFGLGTLLCVIFLVAIPNEIWQRTLHKKKSSQRTHFITASSGSD